MPYAIICLSAAIQMRTGCVNIVPRQCNEGAPTLCKVGAFSGLNGLWLWLVWWFKQGDDFAYAGYMARHGRRGLSFLWGHQPEQVGYAVFGDDFYPARVKAGNRDLEQGGFDFGGLLGVIGAL